MSLGTISFLNCLSLLTAPQTDRKDTLSFTNPDHAQSERAEYSRSVWKLMRKYNGHHCCPEQWRNHLARWRESSQQLLQKWDPSTNHTETIWNIYDSIIKKIKNTKVRDYMANGKRLFNFYNLN